MTLFFVATSLKVNALNDALYQTYQAGDAHAFAMYDDFTRNSHKCLQDRIAALARVEAHNVPVRNLVKRSNLIITNIYVGS